MKTRKGTSPSRRALVGLVALVGSSLSPVTAESARVGHRLTLIVPQSAPLQLSPHSTSLSVRSQALGHNPGPEIRIESPENGGTYSGPVAVKVTFLAGPSGLAVNMKSLRLTYKRLWGIDITSRVRNYLTGTTIDAPGVELPAGEHTVEIYVEDVGANPSSRLVTVKIA